MSIEARQALVDDPRLHLQHDTQRSDLLDPDKTSSWLVAFLQQLLDKSGHPILVTAVKTDHHPGTYHNPADGSQGHAVDCWHADWATVGDDKVVDVMVAAGHIAATGSPTLLEVGLSGDAVKYETYVTWPADASVFVEDYGQDNEHLHFAVPADS